MAEILFIRDAPLVGILISLPPATRSGPKRVLGWARLQWIEFGEAANK